MVETECVRNCFLTLSPHFELYDVPGTVYILFAVIQRLYPVRFSYSSYDSSP